VEASGWETPAGGVVEGNTSSQWRSGDPEHIHVTIDIGPTLSDFEEWGLTPARVRLRVEMLQRERDDLREEVAELREQLRQAEDAALELGEHLEGS
jgi:hypothetical protein